MDQEELLKKIAELDNNWKRALADYKNLEKRVTEERETIVEFANSTLILKLLVVLDNLEMMQKHLNDTGIVLVTKEMKQILEDEGVSEIECLSKEFEPEIMEAVDTGKGEENKVLEVIRNGYTFKNKLLRPARVKVGRGKAKLIS